MEFPGSLRRDENRGIRHENKKGEKEAEKGRKKEIEDARHMKKMNTKTDSEIFEIFK